MRHPYQMPEPPQLALFNANEQWLNSESLKDDYTSTLIPMGDASHPPEESNFSRLYQQSRSFGHNSSLMTIDEERNED